MLSVDKPTSPLGSSRRIHTQDFIPLKVCAKYVPPSIAIFYSLGKDSNKKYLHEIPLPELSKDETAGELYKALIRSEPVYLNPKIVGEKQIVRIIEQIMGKKGINKENNNERCKTADTVTTSKSEEKKIENIAVPMINDKRSELKQELQKELKSSENDSNDDAHYSEDFCEESQEAPAKGKNSVANSEKVAPPVATEPMKNEDENENLDAGMVENEQELPEGFQRVFVEDLGEELLMDPNGNLYDMNGNLIGQADCDEEDDANVPPPKSCAQALKGSKNTDDDDNKYFENSAEKDIDDENF